MFSWKSESLKWSIVIQVSIDVAALVYNIVMRISSGLRSRSVSSESEYKSFLGHIVHLRFMVALFVFVSTSSATSDFRVVIISDKRKHYCHLTLDRQ